MKTLRDNTPKLHEDTLHLNDDFEPMSFREVLIHKLVIRGFHNRSFSHKKEAENRLADSLWLEYKAKTPHLHAGISISSIHVKIDFYAQEVVASISHSMNEEIPGWRNRVHTPAGKAKITQSYDYLDENVLIDYIEKILHHKEKYRPVGQ